MFEASRYFPDETKFAHHKPGEYWPMVSVGDMRPCYAILYCPECGKPISLHDHEINYDGTVVNEVACQNTYSFFKRGEGSRFPNSWYGLQCAFRDTVMLVGYDLVGPDPFAKPTERDAINSLKHFIYEE